jgi:guanine nucleotide-binding protein G(i) subunit alpha
MADPISIIGAAGAVANIIDVLAKTVSTLHELHNQWKQADFTLVNLISQLTALRAGLDKMQEWMSTDMVDLHYQLVMDLEVSMSCCRMLLTKLQSHVSELHRTASNTLDFESKMKLIVKSGTLEELQKMVGRQTIALTLLLTACNRYDDILEISRRS